MEIIVVLVVLGIVLYYFAFRKRPDSVDTPVVEAPYKVETPVAPEPAPQPVVEEVKAVAAKPKKAAKTTKAKTDKPKAAKKAKAKPTSQA